MFYQVNADMAINLLKVTTINISQVPVTGGGKKQDYEYEIRAYLGETAFTSLARHKDHDEARGDLKIWKESFRGSIIDLLSASIEKGVADLIR